MMDDLNLSAWIRARVDPDKGTIILHGEVIIKYVEAYERRIAELESHLPNWQPIEAAPKDKFAFLTDGKKTYIGCFEPPVTFDRYKDFFGDGSTMEKFRKWEQDMRSSPAVAYDEWELFDFSGHPTDAIPTHWMPLPLPPKENE